MPKQRNAFRLGLTVLIMFALLFGTILFIGGSDWGLNATRFVVRFPTSVPLPQEIKPGAQVFCGLQEVGKVLDVRFREVTEPRDALTQPSPRGRAGAPPAPELYTYLTVRVDSSVGLRRDCRITARGPLLGGSGTLQIDNRGVAAEPVAQDMVVDGAAAGTFDAALDMLSGELDPRNQRGLLALVKVQLDAADDRSMLFKLHKSLDDVNAMTAGLSHEINPAQREALLAKLHGVLDNINLATGYLRDELQPGRDAALLGKVHAGLDALNDGLRQAVNILASNRPSIDRTIASVERTADTLDRKIAAPIAEELDAQNPKALLAEVHASFDRLNTTLSDVNVVTDKLRGVVVLNNDQLNRIFANVKETSDHLKAASKDLRLNPWKLLAKPGPFDPQPPPIVEAARDFSEAAANLDDALAQLKAITEARGGRVPADDPVLSQVRARLDATFQKFSAAESALWKQVEGR
ncbi:MAG TPA: hypothetical protein VGM03_17005 [Phycisphaerae bacterium]|jgi:hypothetical protein